MFTCIYSYPLKSSFETSSQLLIVGVLSYLIFQRIYKNAWFKKKIWSEYKWGNKQLLNSLNLKIILGKTEGKVNNPNTVCVLAHEILLK